MTGQVAFTVSGRGVAWSDAIDHARVTGAWDALAGDIAAGVALLHTAGAGRPTSEELKEAATTFRYARNLVAAEELEAWLERWGLTINDWMDHVRRTVLRESHASELGPVQDEEITGRVWASAVCSGTLERVAWELARLLAICDSLAEQGTVVGPADARAELARRVITEDALKAQIQSRALDWIRIDSTVLSFTGQDAAREALALLREGLSTADVAEAARASLEERSVYLEDVDEDLKIALTGSTAGDILGPLEREGDWRVVVVRDKVTPSLDHHEVRSRAGESIVERAIRRETDERVVWHGDI